MVIGACPAWHPFQCPNGDCVPIKYLCDGSPDCSDGYDENVSMCTAGKYMKVMDNLGKMRGQK